MRGRGETGKWKEQEEEEDENDDRKKKILQKTCKL